MTTVTRAASADLWAGDRPVTPDGQMCRFAVRPAGSQDVTYGPSAADALTAVLGEGYASLTPGERLVERRSFAIEVAERVQRRLVVSVGSSAGLDVLFASKAAALTVTSWDGPVPLVLVDSWFAPHGEGVRPSGAVMWVRPESEWDFAQSLADAGVAEVGAAI